MADELILSGHDSSDGGLATTLLEMAFAGNCGIEIDLGEQKDAIAVLFSEELGLVMEYLPSEEEKIFSIWTKPGPLPGDRKDNNRETSCSFQSAIRNPTIRTVLT